MMSSANMGKVPWGNDHEWDSPGSPLREVKRPDLPFVHNVSVRQFATNMRRSSALRGTSFYANTDHCRFPSYDG